MSMLAWHPGDRNDASPRKSLANVSAKFRFHGQSAHAAAAPDKGRSALDGAEAMNYMVNLMREHVPSDARLHYVITNGGEAPNVVPDFAEVFYYCRHPEVDTVMRMKVGEEYHVCNCEGCDCNTVSSVAGKCGCGNDLVAAEVTKVEGNSAYFKAAAWNQDRSFNMVGKYVCGCGPTCTCKTISQKPGKCGCGSDLKKVGN